MQVEAGGTLLEQAVWEVSKIVRQHFRDKAAKIGAAEVWAHLRSSSCPHQLHSDTDERVLRAGDTPSQALPHPVSLPESSCSSTSILACQRLGMSI